MESSRKLLLDPIIQEKICSNLIFNEAVKFRNSLNLPNLKFSFPITDRDRIISFLPGVSDLTIRVYHLVVINGSIRAFLAAAKNARIFSC